MRLDPMLEGLFEYMPRTEEVTYEYIKAGRVPFPEASDLIPVYEVKDLEAEFNGSLQRVRIYRPEEGIRRILFYIHGGGFCSGGISVSDQFCRRLANETGRLVVAAQYRLAPEHKFPAGLEDSYAALCWCAANAEKFGASAEDLAVIGESSGGNFAAVLCLLARDRKGPGIGKQILLFPTTDLFQRVTGKYTASMREPETDLPILTHGMCRSYLGYYVKDPEDTRSPYCSPLLAEDLSHLPAALVLPAQYDPLRDEGIAYGKRLQEAGNNVILKVMEGVCHGYTGFPLAATEETIRMIRNFLQ